MRVQIRGAGSGVRDPHERQETATPARGKPSPAPTLSPEPLERYSERKLPETSARVLRVVDVALRRGDLIDRSAAARLRHRREVDVVERVQHLGMELEVRVPNQRDPLHDAEVEGRHFRTRDVVIAWRA